MSRLISGYITNPREKVALVTDSYTVQRDDGVVNVDAAEATITIPPVFDVGRRILIRKVNDGEGEITIGFSGTEKVTRAALDEVTLTSDGDFWLIEKVKQDRWELVDGYESGSNANGSWRKQKCGIATSYRRYSGGYTANTTKTISTGATGVFISLINTIAAIGITPTTGNDTAYFYYANQGWNLQFYSTSTRASNVIDIWLTGCWY